MGWAPVKSESGSTASTTKPSQAGTVSPAGTVGASGLGAWPHTPLGKAATPRGVSTTLASEKLWASTDARVAVSEASTVALYIGATPSPGELTVADLVGPRPPASERCSAGAVDTRVMRNSGATRKGWAALPSGGLSCPLPPAALPATSPPLVT